MNFFGIGGMELVVILLLAFIILGPRQLISVAKGLGRTISELRNAMNQFTRLLEDDDDDRKGPPPQAKDRP